MVALKEKESDCLALLEKNHELSSKINEFESTLSNLRLDNQKLIEKNNELFDLICENKLLSDKVLELSEANAKFDNDIKEKNNLNKQLSTKVEELFSLNKKLISDKKVEIFDLNSRIKSRDKIIKELNEVKKEFILLQNEHKKCVVTTSEMVAKDVYLKQIEDNDILRNENDSLKSDQGNLLIAYEEARKKGENLEKRQVDIESKIRLDFENQLATLKRQMKNFWNDEMQKKEEEFKEKLSQYKEKIAKDETHIAELSSQLWETSDKLLLAQTEYLKLKSKLQNLALINLQNSHDYIDERRRSLSVGSFPISNQYLRVDDINDRYSLQPVRSEDFHVDEVTQNRRRSFLPAGMGKKFTLPSGKVFPSEDETGEVFDNRNLTDLKEGRCSVPTDSDRISVLMSRNSLCPPHLKSSYPAETQFLSFDTKEEDIKAGVLSGEISQNGLKKNRNQALTSGSNALNKGNTSRGVLSEMNHGDKQKISTPRRLRAMFSASTATSSRSSKLKDENTPHKSSTGSAEPSTPRRKRFSFFNLHFPTKDLGGNMS